MKAHVLSGIDRLHTVEGLLRGRRVALMTNPTGIDRRLTSTIDLINSRFNLTAMFAVEHGIRGDAQAGDDIGATSVDPATGVTVYSAYGANERLNEEMLAAFDVLVFDMQDVGARFYTYLYSLSYAMEACASAGKSVVVLDRVNPIGGAKREGPVIEEGLGSFVGNYALLTRYGLTIGEYARYVKDYLKLDLDLTVVPLEGWERRMYLDDTDLPWVAPSPNCPDLAAALCYVGTCLFEGTNVSEGRGTTQPFQLIGAPFLSAETLEREMNALRLPGLHFRRAYFRPTFSKHAGTLCQGVQMHILDREVAEPFAGGLMLLDTIRRLSPELEFIYWTPNSRPALDKLLGTARYREGTISAQALIEESRAGARAFSERVKPFELYR